MGRPRKDGAERAVQMHLPRWAFELVDEHVRGRAAAALFTMGENTGPTQRELAAARSAYIASLIEAELGWEARHPTSVTVSAPALGDATSMRQAAEWLRKTEAALTDRRRPNRRPRPSRPRWRQIGRCTGYAKRRRARARGKRRAFRVKRTN